MRFAAVWLGLVCLSTPPSAPTSGPLAILSQKYAIPFERVQAEFLRRNGYLLEAHPPDSARAAAYEKLFLLEWSLYAKSLCSKARIRKVFFCEGLAVDGQPRAAVPAFESDEMYYDVALGASSALYRRVVIHHELFHMIDHRMGLLYDDPAYANLNARGFAYGSGGETMRESGVGDLTSEIPGFVTRYATASLVEDKAELFAHMVVSPEFVRRRAAVDPVLRRKKRLLEQRLREFDPNLGHAFWRRVARLRQGER